MQLFHICTKKEFEANGEKKIKWYRAGTLKVTDAGKQYVHMFHQPTTDFYVFESDPVSDETVVSEV